MCAIRCMQSVSRLPIPSDEAVVLGTWYDDAPAKYVITLLVLNPELIHESLLSAKHVQ